eukprot:COSAG02_NODE_35938_length_461_cov_0.770718_1_plen_108_part_01
MPAGQHGGGYGVSSDVREGASTGFGFESQKVASVIPSMRNNVESFNRTILRPNGDVRGSNATGEAVFEFTSSASRWWVPSQTMLCAQLNTGMHDIHAGAGDANQGGTA